MNKTDLSIIIPFRRERYELEETLKNIRDYSDGNIEIIVINDASDDNFDYKTAALRYGAIYIENKDRIGVAGSREIGVKACSSNNFLLLDAHMRFYDKLWVSRIIEELQNDSNALLCCQTKVLCRKNGLLTEDLTRGISFGAYVRLNDAINLFEPKWIVEDSNPSNTTISIPCVLGAGYACRKKYWNYLKGLDGLMQYGNDEAYISMKVWMSGGTCKLLKDIEIGHIYRNNHPYDRDQVYRYYNYLFLCEIFLPLESRKKHLSTLKLFYDKKILGEAQYLLFDNYKLIDSLKKYYKKILINDLSYFKSLNDKYLPVRKFVDSKYEMLSYLTEIIKKNMPESIGLIHGQMGIVIFLYHYARFSNNVDILEFSDRLLNQIIKSIKSEISYCFISGLCGIGWAIEYLYQNSFIEVDINKMLNYIDKKIMEIDPLRIEDLDKDYGLGGIVQYLLARLYSIHNIKIDNPFDDIYLTSVYNRIKKIIEERNTESNSIDVFLDFLYYYNNNSKIEKTNIYDVCSLLNPRNTLIPDLEPGLKGCSGIALNLILEN